MPHRVRSERDAQIQLSESDCSGERSRLSLPISSSDSPGFRQLGFAGCRYCVVQVQGTQSYLVFYGTDRYCNHGRGANVLAVVSLHE